MTGIPLPDSVIPARTAYVLPLPQSVVNEGMEAFFDNWRPNSGFLVSSDHTVREIFTAMARALVEHDRKRPAESAQEGEWWSRGFKAGLSSVGLTGDPI